MCKGMRKMMFGYKTHQIAEHYLNKWDRYQDQNKNRINKIQMNILIPVLTL